MSSEQNISKSKKIKNIVLNVIVYTFFAVCAIALLFSILMKESHEGAVEMFGRRYMTVLTSSMEKCDETDVSEYEIKDIPVDSLIFIDPVPEDKTEAAAWYADLGRGDVLTFRYFYAGQQITITHRITHIEANNRGGYNIDLEGDNKSSDAGTLSQSIDTSEEGSLNYVIGRVTGQNKLLGKLITIVKSRVGLICFIIVPSAIIAILEIIHIVGVINEKKRQDAKKKQDEEMEALRRQLEELKKLTVGDGNVVSRETESNETETNVTEDNNASE